MDVNIVHKLFYLQKPEYLVDKFVKYIITEPKILVIISKYQRLGLLFTIPSLITKLRHVICLGVLTLFWTRRSWLLIVFCKRSSILNVLIFMVVLYGIFVINL